MRRIASLVVAGSLAAAAPLAAAVAAAAAAALADNDAGPLRIPPVGTNVWGGRAFGNVGGVSGHLFAFQGSAQGTGMKSDEDALLSHEKLLPPAASTDLKTDDNGVRSKPLHGLILSAGLSTVGVGQTLDLRVHVSSMSNIDVAQPKWPLPPGVPGGLKIWAFVNGSQWGAPVTPPATRLLLPMPRVGTANVEVALLPLTVFPSPAGQPELSPSGFPVGTQLNQSWGGERSNTIQVTVSPRVVAPPVKRQPSDPTVLIEWESEFSAHYNTWISREATPLCGLYSSYNTDVHRQHALWLVEAGVDAVLLDWVDTLFSVRKGARFDSNAAGYEDMDASVAAVATWAQMREEGLPTPLAVPLLGLDNGNPGVVNVTVLQQQVEWTGRALRDRFPRLLLQNKGLPLMVIFDTTGTAMNGSYPGLREVLNTTGWSVKWMSAFLNNQREQARAGYWSWTDGSATPVRSSNPHDPSRPEAVTVKPAFFRTSGGPGPYTAPGGWLAPESQPQHQGSTLLMQMRAALQAPQPSFVIVSQFNEFTATECSNPPLDTGRSNTTDTRAQFRSCADTYNATLTDDIEPTSLTECGDVKLGDSRCGGWGFTALNYLRAAIWALRNHSGDAGQDPCVLAILQPDDESSFAVGTARIMVEWRTLTAAAPGAKFSVQVDGVRHDCHVSRGDDVSSCEVDTSRLQSGKHVVTVTAEGAWTHLDLSRDSFKPFSKTALVPSASVHVNLMDEELPVVAQTGDAARLKTDDALALQRCEETTDVDFWGADLLRPDGKLQPLPANTSAACCALCTAAAPRCGAWSWNRQAALCFLKSDPGVARAKPGDISGRVLPGASFADFDLVENFAFGVVMDAYQFEGSTKTDGRGPSNLDVWCHWSMDQAACQGVDGCGWKVCGDVGAGFYKHWKDDVALMAAMGQKHLHFQIAWTRILPDGGSKINELGVKFYSDLLDELIVHGITPWVSLEVFDFPQVYVSKYGGWLGRGIVDEYARFAALCFKLFGDRVAHWFSFHEPNTFCEGYVAPWRFVAPRPNANDSTTPDLGRDHYTCIHNMLLSHGHAAQALRQAPNVDYDKVTFSLISGLDWATPINASEPSDVAATERQNLWAMGVWFDPLVFGDYPKEVREAAGDRLPTFTAAESTLLKNSSHHIAYTSYGSVMCGAPAPSPPPSTACTFLPNTTYTGGVAGQSLGGVDKAGCCGYCRANPNCSAAVLDGTTCYPKTAAAKPSASSTGLLSCVVSGSAPPPAPPSSRCPARNRTRWPSDAFDSDQCGECTGLDRAHMDAGNDPYLRGATNWCWLRYGRPVIVAESGIGLNLAKGNQTDSGNVTASIDDDVARVSKLRSVWTEAHKAIRDGANLAGIFHWSFLDNLEWGSGYSLHFGLVFVGETI